MQKKKKMRKRDRPTGRGLHQMTTKTCTIKGPKTAGGPSPYPKLTGTKPVCNKNRKWNTRPDNDGPD